MKRLFILFAWLTPMAITAGEKPLDASFLRQYAETRGFLLGRPVNPKPSPDGKTVLFLRSEAKNPKRSLYEFDCSTGKTKELLTADALLKGAEEKLTPEEKARRERMRVSAGGFADYHLDETGRFILLPLSGKLFVCNRSANSSKELKIPAGTIIDAKWSPDGKWVSYVRETDVYVYELATDKETAVTTGGTPVKTNGLAEFVAQEEMGRFSGYWWSPDSKQIAFEEVDHTGVETWYVADPTKPDQKPLAQYYPRPGKKNVAVRLGIVPITGGKPTFVTWDTKTFEYLCAVKWDKSGPLTIQIQDRKQQEIQLHLVDPGTGTCRKLLEEKDTAFTNIRQDMPRWVRGRQEFLWVSEYGKGPGLELRRADGSLTDIAIPYDIGFQSLVHVDPDRSEVVYLGSLDSTQMHAQSRFFQAPLLQRRPDTDKSIRLGEGEGIESVVFSENKDVFVLTRTSPGEMPRSFVHTRDKRIGELPGVGENPPVVPVTKFEQVGKEPLFNTNIVLPQNFDSKKKYPVIVDVYGGPHHLHVVRAMRNWLLPQWLADQGFIVVAIENRGTPGHGRDWERSIYQRFGQVPIEDQVAGLKLLAEKYPAMDLDRVGITGWSFGGYMSALAVLKRPDVYKAAVAGAPVTDWEDYDTHYTERYMGLLPESKKEYEASSLLPLAGKLERPLLLVHGTADDNVYFRHTLRLTDALFRAGRDFEVLPLPGLTHMVPDPVVTERLWTRVAGHFQKHLGKPIDFTPAK
ncbi:S9 family peptidase [Zavarzinella formosa]|uniref:S9 family peptidase n=1 Tax=Zavarzinella formosa TaxID=360055 RepID=UPI00059404EB|nr:S9 family peptidase [Zavarzinella formosa]